MSDVAAYNIIWIIVLGVFLTLLVWRCVRRQQILAYQREIYGTQPSVQMMTISQQPSSFPPPPPGYSAVLVNGQVVYQPLYSAAPSYPPPLYSPSGTYAAVPPHSAVVAIPVQYYDQAASFRLNDEPGAPPAVRSPHPSAPPLPSAAHREEPPALNPAYRQAEERTGEDD